MKKITIVVLAACFPMTALAGSLVVENNDAALANDAGVSQAQVQAGTDYFNSDQNSDGYQNSNTLQTGNRLGGQAQVQGSLAATQSLSAQWLDPAIARYLSLYRGYYSDYLGYLDDANAASSRYSACVAAKGTDCLNKAGYYDDLAGQAYDQYRYYYGLWYQDVQQQLAMQATAGQQATLAGSSAQASQQDYGDYQAEQNVANTDAAASASDTQTGNAGNNATGDASGTQSAQQALQTIQKQTGVPQGQSVAVPTASGQGFSYTSPLQNQMDSLTQAAIQDAQQAVLQSQYADNRAAAADTATAQAEADGAAASVAPTRESGQMWLNGEQAAEGTAAAYQSDAQATQAAAQAAQQGFVADQNQANADALTIAQQQDQAAEAYAEQQAQKAGVQITAPVMSDTGAMTQLTQAQNTINQAQTTAEVDAEQAYSQQRIAEDAQSNAETDAQQAAADQANAAETAKESPSLGKTWGSLSGSYAGSASAEAATAQTASRAASADLAAGNAAEQQAKMAAGSTGVNGLAGREGADAAQQALQAIQAQTGVPQN